MSKRSDRPFRVLSVDGGGIRGYYTATLLHCLATHFAHARRKPVASLDVGKGFDLIVGTSTGGIIACGLAAGFSTQALVDLYKMLGPRVFQHPIPANFSEFVRWVPSHLSGAANDPAPFRTALTELFGTLTLDDVYRARHIALCIPAVNIEDRRSWVFETPHTPDRARGNYRVVDVCLATSAAPLYFPVAVIEDPSPSAPGQHHAFVDGGLWANNPIVIALVEALDLAPPGKSVEIISLTTCPPRTEETVLPGKGANWGIWDWRVGIKALNASLDAQSSRYSGIVKALAPHLERPCRIVRLEPTSTAPELHFDIVMDRTSDEILAALARRAREDAKHYFAEARKYQRHHPFAGDPKDRRALRFDDFSILGATFDAMPTLGTAKRAAHHARTAPRQAPEASVHTG